MKILKNIEDKSEKQLKAIKDQKKKVDMLSQYKIKAPVLKNIYSKEVRDRRVNDREAKRVFKILEDMEGSKIDYSNLVYRSGDNKYFNFAEFALISSFYLRLMNNKIGINLAKLNMNEFKYRTDELFKKKQKKQHTKNIKKIS